MSERQRSRRQVAAGATIAMGATLAATGTAQADTITVANLNDEGAGSLREAILEANNNGAGTDDIVFASGLSGTIDVGSTGGFGLYPLSSMSIQGGGRITLRGSSSVDYVLYTGAYAAYGSNPGDAITLSGLTITGGSADDTHGRDFGGGIYNESASLTVSSSTVTGNYASDSGAGIYTYSPQGPLTIVNSTISDNSAGDGTDAGDYGAGIFSYASDVTIRNSTLSGNRSGGDGGAVYMGENGQPSLTIESSTIADNASLADGAHDQGGGIWTCCGDDGQQLNIKSSTITGNSVGGADGRGGGAYVSIPGPQVSIQNTILADNSGTSGNDIYSFYGGQLGFSLLKDPTSATSSSYSFDDTGPNITGVDPQLGPLADNGGLTRTELPSGASPVVDKGNAFGLSSDERGVQRPIDFPAIPNAGDGADIGAVELQPSSAFKLGKLKRNKRKGTAKQVVILPLPDAGAVTIRGKGLRSRTRLLTGAAKVRLPVIAKGKRRKALRRNGRAKFKAKISYQPAGSALRTLKKKLKLLKR
jgi:hypothetical protein